MTAVAKQRNTEIGTRDRPDRVVVQRNCLEIESGKIIDPSNLGDLLFGILEGRNDI